MKYPYHLGCHLKTHRLCRIPHPDLGYGIPPGFARVVWYRILGVYNHKRNPYDEDGELRLEYYSIVRWTDIQIQLGEKLTGPNMAFILAAYRYDHES